ncbi:MAG: tetratricopeptide repeat protein, partial [Bdellovibrionaceae bacterium]|nr:tetratricopeptide repeat protein [Pseudobdellovibrionaceae bacterium]
LARHLSIAEKLSEALCVWQGILKLEFTPEAVREIAHLHYKTGENQHALNSYYEYLAVAPEDDPHIYEVFKNMGNIFTRTGDYDSAEEYYHRAFRLRPYSDVLMVNYATLSYQRGELDRAVEFFRNAVRTNPKNEMGWTGLAMMHRQFGDFDLAWADLERGLELAPQNRSAVILAADWAIKDRKEVRGAEIVSEYLSLAGPDEEMSLVLINLFCAMGRLELADIEIERVLSWNPSRKDVRELREKLRDKL